MRPIRILILAAVCAAAASTAFAQAPDAAWPRWRGARFDGIATTGREVFAEPFALRVRWRKTLGAGYSGIVIAEGHAVTMFSDGTTDFLVALSSATGEERWRVPLAATFPPRDGSTGGPVSTPAIDSGVAYGLGPRGELVAVTLATGKVLWQTHLVRDLGAEVPHWGFTTSPLVWHDLLIVMTGGAPDRAVTAFDRTTGAVAWRAGSDAASYQSPMLTTIGGREAVLAGGDTWLVALDPRDGREIWKTAHGGTGFFAMIVNPVEVGADRWLVTHKPGESVLIGANADAPVWSTRELRGNYSQPIYHRGMLFGMAGTFLSCIDAATGERRWRSRPPGDGFPILVDGHLVIATKDGGITVAEASGEAYREKASLALFDRLVWTPPSFAEGRIFVRDSYDGIAAVDVVPARETTAAAPAGDGEARAAATPDADSVRRIAAQPVSPVIEGGRAHFTFSGAVDGLELLVDGRDADAPLPLARVDGTDIVHASLPFERDARVAYQFIRNGAEVVDDPRNPRQGQSLNRAGTSRLLLMPGADPLPPVSGAIGGTGVDLEFETPVIRASHLQWGGKRAVHVYLPPGYAADTSVRYPTAYVMYGDEMREAQMDALVDREIGGSGLAPMIVVFVQSTSGFEYARTFREAHQQMLAGELVPWIDRRFRTRTGAPDRVLVGIDEAGFGVVETALRHPEVFGAAIAQSLFAMTGAGDDLVTFIARTPPAGQRFVVEWGKYDYRRSADLTDVPGYSKRVREALAARGYAVSGREWNDGMSLTFAVDRMVKALRTLFPMPAAR
jgi:outer membrane protein assembly factor BamB